MSLTDASMLGEGDTAKLDMKLIADKEAKTLTLIDRGCGARPRRAARAHASHPSLLLRAPATHHSSRAPLTALGPSTMRASQACPRRT